MPKKDEFVKIPIITRPKRPGIFKRLLVTLFLLAVVMAVAALISYAASLARKTNAYTFEDCIQAVGSVIEKSYPQVCTTKEGIRFVQKIPPEEQKLLELPIQPTVSDNTDGVFCGGIMGTACPEGFMCKYEGDYPDASGTCIKN